MLNIFEYPWALLITATLILIIIWIIRTTLPQKKHWWQLTLPVLLTIAAFGLDILVQTDTEKIKTVINTATMAAQIQNPDAIEPLISDNYHDSLHRTKASLLVHCKAMFSEPLIEKNITRIISMDIQKPDATAIFTVRTVFDKQSHVYQNFKRMMLTKIKLDLQKQKNKKWLISRSEILEIDLQKADWKEIMRVYW